MRIHFIAIGGAIMHQLAITSANKGHIVTGSDDVIQEPSRSRLVQAGILPLREGFFSENITDDIELVILGMHAKFDNVELTRAMEKGLKVLSFPEYIYESSITKTRAVIAGSHGKTSITSMVMHCLKVNNIEFDYLVGSSVAGFDYSVKLSDAPIIVIEGDEYLASPITKEPKFIYYHAHIATLSGIEWDHINVFKTEDIYNEQFVKLVNSMESNGKLFYYNDPKVKSIIADHRVDIDLVPYEAIPYKSENEVFIAETELGDVPLSIFGKHNMENIQAAKHVCNELGLKDKEFWSAIASFHGAGRRLEIIVDSPEKVIYKDFAHSPSKLNATVNAVKEKYHSREVIACFEMHTFSTLTPEFLPQYQNTMSEADTAIVFIDKDVVEKKGNKIFDETEIKMHFGRNDILFFTDKNLLKQYLDQRITDNPVYLMMSSGTFGGLDLKEIGEKSIAEKNANILSINVENPQNHGLSDRIFETKNLSKSEKESLLLMFGLSFLFFILSPLMFYLLKKDECSETEFNIISSCLNFQTISVLILIIGYALSSFIGILLLSGFIFNAYFTYSAIQSLLNGESVEIPQGLRVILPIVDKS